MLEFWYFQFSEFTALSFDESAGFSAPPAFGPYRVLHQIGSGALGPVFRTYEPQRDRLVAVKAFRLDLVPERVAELADSLRRLVNAKLTHPAIVAALDAGLEGTIAYLAMEYVAAETLDVALRHLAPAPIDRAWPLLGRIAEAIDAGWAAGHGHGALHPRDVFVTPATQDIRVSGFGVVQSLEHIGVKAPLRRPYSAPERVAGESFDITADVYSLGAIAHELLTGRRPAGPGEQDGALTTGTTPEHRVMIRRILSGALAERPRDRFATAGAFVTALRDVARGDAVGPLPAAANIPPAQAPTPAETPVPPKRSTRFAASRTITPDWTSRPVPPATPPPPASVVIPADVKPVEATPVPAEATPEPVAVASDAPKKDEEAVEHGRRHHRKPEPQPEGPWQPLPPQRASRLSAPSITSVPLPIPEPAPTPWVAFIAIAIAGVVLGGVIGYLIGVSRGTRSSPPAAAAVVTPAKPADTEVPVKVEPPPPPPVTTEAPPPPSTSTLPSASLPPPPARSEAPTPKPRAQPPVTPKPPEAARAASAGRLLVRSVPPGASVSIDGKAYGVTPVTVRELSLGTHTILLSRAGYVNKIESVTLTAHEPAKNLTLELFAKKNPQ